MSKIFSLDSSETALDGKMAKETFSLTALDGEMAE